MGTMQCNCVVPGCDCAKSKDFIAHMQRQKLYQPLMGLNESYMQARSQIIMMIPLPNVNQPYAMLISDESHRVVSTSSSVLGPALVFSTALYSNKSAGYNGGYHNSRKYSPLQCDVCKGRGHTKETCYRVWLSYRL